jgi:UDP-N-acetylglucosamine transferase subunit ALG13
VNELHSSCDVLLVVGTDHHPFDRVVRWVDAWAQARGRAERVVIQYGTSAAPTYAVGHELLDHSEVLDLMLGARAVVTHGGPATIVEVRSLGKRPIVVARDPQRGEHVDEHQQLFTRRFADRSLIELCETEETLIHCLDEAMVATEEYEVGAIERQAYAIEVAEAVVRTGALIDEVSLVGSRRR